MKNFKKVIILSFIIIIIVIYLIYNHLNDNVDEVIEEDLYIDSNTNIEELNKIILHITGEVKEPRDYRD